MIDAAETSLCAQRTGRSRLVRPLCRTLGLLALIVMGVRFTGCMERMFYQPTVAPTPVPHDLRGAEPVAFDSGDGTRLSGWFIPAAGIDAGSASTLNPTILHVHGNAGNVSDHVWFTEYLPPNGFNIFIFDYRGYGQSAGRARTREQLIADTNAALEYLLSREDVDQQRIGMYGQSLGGAIGLNVMAERPEIRAAVIESGFASWRDEAAFVVGGEPPSWWARGLAWLLISDRRRADAAIARCAPRPVLLVHGSADNLVPASNSRLLKQAGGDNVEWIEYEGGEHNSLRESHPEMEAAVIEFFKRTIGSVGTAADGP